MKNPKEIRADFKRLLSVERSRQRVIVMEEDSQTIHAASVRHSVALSLQRLQQRYLLAEEQISHYGDLFVGFIDALSTEPFQLLNGQEVGDNACITVAIRSIQRINQLAKDASIQEARTQFSLRKIIALIWCALSDQAVHRERSLAIKNVLVQSLFDIQRTYQGKNNEDVAACVGGTINALVNVLNGIHPDVNIMLINQALISELSYRCARRVFLQQFTEEMTESSYFNGLVTKELQYDANTWINPLLAHWYQMCLDRVQIEVRESIHSKMHGMAFLPEDSEAVNNELEVWLEISSAALWDSKRLLIESQTMYWHRELSIPLVPINAGLLDQADDFSRLLAIIRQAICVESTFQRSHTHIKPGVFTKTLEVHGLFKAAPANIEKIALFCALLAEKNPLASIAWLAKAENALELTKGVFSRAVKQALEREASLSKAPFGCSNVEHLLACVASFASTEISSVSDSLTYRIH